MKDPTSLYSDLESSCMMHPWRWFKARQHLKMLGLL